MTEETTFDAIVKAINDGGAEVFATSHQSGGGIYVAEITFGDSTGDKRLFCFGNCAEVWSADVYPSQEAYEQGTGSIGTMDTDLSTDIDNPVQVADAFYKALKTLPAPVENWEWLEALTQYCSAASKVSSLWPEADVNAYPDYLPSFDEHVHDMFNFADANNPKTPEGPANVYEYFEQKMHTSPDNDGLRDFPLESVCGEACVNIIDSATALLAICDPHPDVVKNIRAGVNAAIDIVCFG